ncbi:amino acid transporter [Arthrobacter sp. Sa2CUA1]|uniref:Amino acid transporter n=1 Tax=Arthrobacter gallicola TaxID=2762225 RepID=A0ABR8UQT1_9MICC|nr:LysE/ArgO family amino acid transporter [Arthrobacter gallicola]MBD7994901.1 amino acid transporter [Arthrobacter gallicola]
MTTVDLSAFFTGLGSGLALIVAIGAQNAFVLRQGIRREHLFPVLAVCILSDAVLILLGTAGIGKLTETAPLVLDVIRWAGAAFLLAYAVLSFRRAIRPAALEATGGGRRTVAAAVLTCLSLTWLNPHVYLDTVVLLGSLAASQGPEGRWVFAAGAVAASTLWFSALGFGARLLAPVFARPIAWRVLDLAIGVFMVVLALSLMRSSL